MKRKYQNLFFAFGIAMFAVMLSQLDYREVWDGLKSAGYWFFAVLALWGVLYVLNTAAWYIIIKSGSEEKTKINFFWLYKITVSGFALNYTTPCGLMGGEPYRIMALSPKIGTERASSSVILYAMTHIFTHFIFWLLSIFLYLLTEKLTFFMGVILSLAGAFCVLGLWFFIKGYRKGLAVRLMNFVRHIPGLKKWARGFIDKHKEQLDTVDSQIAALHNQNPKTFVSAVLLELVCRFCSAFEIMFILLVLMDGVFWPSPACSPTCCFSFRCSLAAARAVSLCLPPDWPCRPARAYSSRSSCV